MIELFLVGAIAVIAFSILAVDVYVSQKQQQQNLVEDQPAQDQRHDPIARTTF